MGRWSVYTFEYFLQLSKNNSPTHFRRLFLKHNRQSPREAHPAAKMRRACDNLVYSDLTITEIADQFEFINVHNFSRAFRKAVGQPPTAYHAGA